MSAFQSNGAPKGHGQIAPGRDRPKPSGPPQGNAALMSAVQGLPAYQPDPSMIAWRQRVPGQTLPLHDAAMQPQPGMPPQQMSPPGMPPQGMPPGMPPQVAPQGGGPQLPPNFLQLMQNSHGSNGYC